MQLVLQKLKLDTLEQINSHMQDLFENFIQDLEIATKGGDSNGIGRQS